MIYSLFIYENFQVFLWFGVLMKACEKYRRASSKNYLKKKKKYGKEQEHYCAAGVCIEELNISSFKNGNLVFSVRAEFSFGDLIICHPRFLRAHFFFLFSFLCMGISCLAE